MKKITKKILSMMLAVIMLLSVVPVGYAAEMAVEQAYLEELAKFVAYSSNVYEPEDLLYEYVNGLFMEFFEKHEELEYGFYITEKELAENADSLSGITEDLEKVNSAIEKEIAEREVVIIIDTYDLCEAEIMFSHYEDRLTPEMLSHIRNSDLYKEFVEVRENTYAGFYSTQGEYDSATAPYVVFCETVVNHILGEHDFVEYISDNNATEDADGTKTATCEFCGATDTVVDEGSQLVREPASFFEKLIALIKKFFAKIFAIFG